MTSPRGAIWPVLLIVVGVVLLLGNEGVLSFRLIDILTLWPLVLVIAGIELAVARRSPVAALIADLAVIALGVALLVVQPALPAALSIGGGSGTTTVSAPRDGATSLALHVSGGAGTYRIHGGSSELVDATSDLAQLHLTSTDRSGGAKDVRVQQTEDRQLFRISPSAAAHVEVRMASDIPTSLAVNAGAGDFTVDLSDVKATDARINVGAASLRLVLPKPTGDVQITVGAGASSVVIEIPDGVEARITTSGALTSLHSENARVSGSETAGYASATDRVTVRVTAGASSITIR